MRLAAYTGTSMVLAAGVVIRALHERANFYSAAVYVSQSTACVMILLNVGCLALGHSLIGLQRLLYGPLRPIETEQLYERAWISLTETCLAMTIFREEVGVWFIVMFLSLLIGKVWSWISEGRLDILEQQPPDNPRLFHARLSASLALSFLFDLYMLYFTVSTVRNQARPNMMVMFAFEFAVLTTISLSTCARYGLSLKEAAVIKEQTSKKLQEQRQRIEQEREAANREARENGEEGPTFPPINEEVNELEIDVPGWEEKGRWLFYLNIVTDFLKLILYMTFFCVLCIFYGMPIHIIRDVAFAIQSFYKRINDFVKYRHATRDMNERYPDATAEQIGREDTCIICREVMREYQPNADPPMEDRLRPKKLPCNHVLHLACLRSWLERQQNCPTCRQNVLEDSPASTAAQNRNIPGQAGENRRPGQPRQQQGGQGEGPGQGQGQGQGQNRPRNRMRFLNLGPLRLGFGAGNMQDLQREIQAQARERRQRPNEPGAFRRAGQRGWADGAAAAERWWPSSHPAQPAQTSSINTQLQSIERQLMTELNTNLLQQEQLRVVRAMQGELARLRIRQADVSRGDAVTTGLPPPATLGPLPSLPSMSSAPGLYGSQAYTSRQQVVYGSGHPDLPPGLTIPEGWQLMPLEPAQGLGGGAAGGQFAFSGPMPGTQNFYGAGPSNAQNVRESSPPFPPLPPDPFPRSSAPFTAATNPTAPESATSNPPNNEPVSSELQNEHAQHNGSIEGSSRINGQERNEVKAEDQERPPAGFSGLPQWGSNNVSTSNAEGSSSSTQDHQHANGDAEGKGKRKVPTVEDAPDEEDMDQ